MKKKWINVDSPGQISIVEGVQEPPGPDQLLVESVISGISSGTESKFLTGDHTHGSGLFTKKDPIGQKKDFPFKIGYSMIGKVKEGGSEELEDDVGKWVFAYVPHQTSFLSKRSDLVYLPDDVDPEQFVYLANLETALSLTMDGGAMIGEEVLVLGQGVVGLLLTNLLSSYPISNLVTVERNEIRREASKKFGADKALEPEELAADYSPGKGFDLVYDVTGNLEALMTGARFCGFSGRLILGSYYGEESAAIILGDGFHRKRIRLRSSQVSTIDPELSGRWTTGRRMELAKDLASKIYKDTLITHRYRFEDAGEAYEKLLSSDKDHIQMIFQY